MMKQHHSWNSMLKACAMLFVSVFCLASCYNDDEIKSDISDLRSRVTSLEEWQKSVNSDIQSIQTIVEALQKQNYITAVTPFSGGGETGYTIAFNSGETINIRNGKDGKDGTDGKSPDLSVKEYIDGVYYWTVNGNFLTDAAGNKMPVTGPKGEKGDKGDQGDKGDIGDKGETGAQGEKGQTGETGAQGESGTSGNHAIAPQLRISDANIWQISTDDGKTWKDMTDSQGNSVKATGEKGAQGENGAPGKDGDSFFAEKDPVVVSDNYVTFTLKDGTTFTVPRTNGISINFSFENLYYTKDQTETDITVNLANLTADNFSAIYADAKSNDGKAVGIATRAAQAVKVTIAPDYKTANINISGLSENTGDLILKVTVVTNDNKEISSSKVLKLLQPKEPDYKEGEYYNIKTPEEWIWLTETQQVTLQGGSEVQTIELDNYRTCFSNYWQSANYPKHTIVNLEADLDFGGATIKPLGMTVRIYGSSDYFRGINGNGHTIKNFKIKENGDAGLFKIVTKNYDDSKGVVKNLTIENAQVEGKGRVGIVTPYVRAGNIENVTIKNSTAKLLGKNGQTYNLGAICGLIEDLKGTIEAYGASIKDCKLYDCKLYYDSSILESSTDGNKGEGKIYGKLNSTTWQKVDVSGNSDEGVTIIDLHTTTAQ